MSGALAHSPADVVRNLLVDLGLGTTPSDAGSWPVYAAQEPNTPDSVITIYDTAGRKNGRTQVDGEVQEHHGIQIRVRDANHQDGYAKARAIAVALDEQVAAQGVVVDDIVGTGQTTYVVWNVSRTTDVLSLGKETPTSKRNLFTINAVAALRQLTKLRRIYYGGS